jgi:hypothetical protein
VLKRLDIKVRDVASSPPTPYGIQPNAQASGISAPIVARIPVPIVA